MSPLLRISWLIAGTLLVARLAKVLVDVILWYVIRTSTLSVPQVPFSFVRYLNAAARPWLNLSDLKNLLKGD